MDKTAEKRTGDKCDRVLLHEGWWVVGGWLMPHAIQHLLKRTSLFVVVNYRVQTVINCGAFVMFIERLTVTGDYYFATNMYHVIGGPYEVARSFVDVARQTSGITQ